MMRLILFLSFISFSTQTFAVTAQLVAEAPNKDSIWGIQFLNENELIFSERAGSFNILDVRTKKITPVKSDISVVHKGQGGLLDVGLPPSTGKDKWLYFTYSCAKPGGNTTCLGKAKLTVGAQPALTERKEVFAALPVIDSRLHFGSRIAWNKSGQLFMSMGDRYSQKKLAQKTDNHLGKVLRVSDDGKAEVWSYGHRNIQGLAFDENDQLWEQEHGAKGGDEINKIEKGKNYGWPEISHGVDYTGLSIGTGKSAGPGLEQPFYHFTPSIAPSGLLIYSGKKFKDWKGHIFSGSLALTHLNRLIVENGKPVKEDRLFKELRERVRDVSESPAGEIYFSTDSGKIYRILP
jgi:aldose sugar dehydrogenase